MLTINEIHFVYCDSECNQGYMNSNFDNSSFPVAIITKTQHQRKYVVSWILDDGISNKQFLQSDIDKEQICLNTNVSNSRPIHHGI